MLGSTFDAGAGTTRVNPTALSARLSPVPAAVSAAVDILSPSSYQARLTTSSKTTVTIDYTDVDGPTRTHAVATISTLPSQLDLTFNDSEIAYTASSSIDRVDMFVETTKPGPSPEFTPETKQLDVVLRGLPKTARLQRTSPTHITFTSAGAIVSSKVRFASVNPPKTLPPVSPSGEQYLTAVQGLDFLVAEVRVLGLSRFEIDTGDQVVVDVTHTAGPFHINADITTLPAPRPPLLNLKLTADINNLPATAKVTYTRSTQAFTYDGSAVIANLTADLASSRPLVDDATRSHLVITNFPTGLTGRFDAAGETFTASLPAGAAAMVEAWVSNATAPALPQGVDGVLVEDHGGHYNAFARITGLRRVIVGWGSTKLADVDHTAGPFLIHVDNDDTPALEFNADVRDLPARARVEYDPGHPPPARPPTPATLTYTGSAPIGRLILDIVGASMLIPSSHADDGYVGANEAHVVMWNLPSGEFPAPGQPAAPSLVLGIDGVAKQLFADIPDGLDQGFTVRAEFCSTGACTPAPPGGEPLTPPTDPDRFVLSQLRDSYILTTQVSGVSALRLDWADPLVVDLLHRAGPFDVSMTDRYYFQKGPFEHEDDATTVVEVRNLPAHVHLEYSDTDQSVSYNGFGESIESLEAWHSRPQRLCTVVANVCVTLPGWPEPIGERATEAHLLVNGLPSGVDLKFDFDGFGDSFSVVASGGVIGHVGLELLSHVGVLDAFTGHPLLTGTADGIAYWTLDNLNFDHNEALGDPFAIVARVTNLRSLFYSKIHTTNGNTHDESTSVQLDRAGGPDLLADVRKSNSGKLPAPLGGSFGDYRYEYNKVNYEGPPDLVGVNLHKRSVLLIDMPDCCWPDLTKDMTKLTLRGSGEGTALHFESNIGKFAASLVTADVAPIPAGGIADISKPAIAACLSTNGAWCSWKDIRNGGHDEVSAHIEVAAPVHVDIRTCGTLYPNEDGSACDPSWVGSRLDINLDIERSVTVMAERVDLSFDFDPMNLHIDTGGGFVDGSIQGQKLDIVIPEGFVAVNRYGQMDCDPTPCSFTNSSGEMTCPAGMHIEAAVAPTHDPNFEDELCSGPQITSVARLLDPRTGATGPAELRPGESGTLVITGSGFSPYSCPDWMPPEPPVRSDCVGSIVTIGDSFGNNSDDIDIGDPVWVSLTEVRVPITVDPDAAPGQQLDVMV